MNYKYIFLSHPLRAKTPTYGNKGKFISEKSIEDMSLIYINVNLLQVIVAPLIVENENGGPVTVIAKIFN